MKSEYKVVEVNQVTDVDLERALNTWIGQGWTFDHIRFITRESQRRPSMAFIFFTRPVGVDESAPEAIDD